MLIKNGLPKKERARILIETAKEQKKVLDSVNFMNSIKKVNDATFLDAQKFLDTKNGKKE